MFMKLGSHITHYWNNHLDERYHNSVWKKLKWWSLDKVLWIIALINGYGSPYNLKFIKDMMEYKEETV